eukprot:scaffold5005_cov98-Isochrysis_galbana.AAC.2
MASRAHAGAWAFRTLLLREPSRSLRAAEAAMEARCTPFSCNPSRWSMPRHFASAIDSDPAMSAMRSTIARSLFFSMARRSGPMASASKSAQRATRLALDSARRHSATHASNGSQSSATTRAGVARPGGGRSAARSRPDPRSKRTVAMPARRSLRARSGSAVRPSHHSASRGRAHSAPKTRRSTCMPSAECEPTTMMPRLCGRDDAFERRRSRRRLAMSETAMLIGTSGTGRSGMDRLDTTPPRSASLTLALPKWCSTRSRIMPPPSRSSAPMHAHEHALATRPPPLCSGERGPSRAYLPLLSPAMGAYFGYRCLPFLEQPVPVCIGASRPAERPPTAPPSHARPPRLSARAPRGVGGPTQGGGASAAPEPARRAHPGAARHPGHGGCGDGRAGAVAGGDPRRLRQAGRAGPARGRGRARRDGVAAATQLLREPRRDRRGPRHRRRQGRGGRGGRPQRRPARNRTHDGGELRPLDGPASHHPAPGPGRPRRRRRRVQAPPLPQEGRRGHRLRQRVVWRDGATAGGAG